MISLDITIQEDSESVRMFIDDAVSVIARKDSKGKITFSNTDRVLDDEDLKLVKKIGTIIVEHITQ